jgi:hypothetical protein
MNPLEGDVRAATTATRERRQGDRRRVKRFTSMISLKLTADQHDAICESARLEETDVSAFVRDAVERRIADRRVPVSPEAAPLAPVPL